MIDLDKLSDSLNNLRGLDFELAESQTRSATNTNLVVPMITFVKEFQARLAALALKVPYADIAELPIKQYNKVCNVVQNFLSDTSETETVATN